MIATTLHVGSQLTIQVREGGLLHRLRFQLLISLCHLLLWRPDTLCRPFSTVLCLLPAVVAG